MLKYICDAFSNSGANLLAGAVFMLCLYEVTENVAIASTVSMKFNMRNLTSKSIFSH